jgi:hypothetical protein
MQYEAAHKTFEDNFWSTKMGLKGASNEALARTKTDYESERCLATMSWAICDMHGSTSPCMPSSHIGSVIMLHSPPQRFWQTLRTCKQCRRCCKATRHLQSR